MTLKQAIANSLLMFVAATCVVLIVKALPQTPPAPPGAPNAAWATGGPARQTAGSGPDAAEPDGVRVYYLHGNVRCPTCRTIEAYAREAVESGFADEMKKGRIQWQVINYESPGNEHYAKQYEIVAPSVVLAMFKEGKQVKWKDLPEVWDHVSDKAGFLAFMDKSLREFLAETQPEPAKTASASAPTAAKPAEPAGDPVPPPLPLPE
mgnify:CR=1 FL=1